MARLRNGADGTPKQPTVDEIKQWYSQHKTEVENFASAQDAIKYLRDVTKTITHTNIPTFDKERLRTYLESISSHEDDLRHTARFLYYRSHIFFRLVRFYSSMFDLKCRLVTPTFEIGETPDKTSMLKNYNSTLNLLELMNLQNNMHPVLERCFLEDTCYALFFMDDTGSFFYIMDPDICVINGRFQTGNFSFAVDMSKYNTTTKQREIEFLGEPLKSMYDKYKSTGIKYQTVPQEYCACFKFRDDIFDMSIPPFVSLFNSIINLADLENIQAIANQQMIYKLIYYPLKTISGSKNTDDFVVSPDIAVQYFNKLLDEALPDYCAGAVVPGDELGVINFSDSADTDTDRVQNAQDTILNTSGGGMILNTSKITTQAGFEAALKAETEFAISSLLPQIDGFTNMILINKLGKKACKVTHLELSVYTRKQVADDLLKSCQYSFSNRLAYNTCLGISEKQTLAMEYLENDVLGLHQMMNHPLSSSFTTTAADASDPAYSPEPSGAPTKDADDLSDAGSASRDK